MHAMMQSARFDQTLKAAIIQTPVIDTNQTKPIDQSNIDLRMPGKKNFWRYVLINKAKTALTTTHTAIGIQSFEADVRNTVAVQNNA